MVATRNRVVYEVTISAKDVGSGKTVRNVLYYRNQVRTGAPFTYGANNTGANSTSLLLAAIYDAWSTWIMPFLNANYTGPVATLKAIIGKQFQSPVLPMALWFDNGVTIQVNAPTSSFTVGDAVFVQGVTNPPLANGTFTVASISGPNVLFLNRPVAIAGVWSGDGVVQAADGILGFRYADKLELISALTGSVVGEALPLFTTASIRRISSGVGKNFRSRFSVSPMSEVDQLDGGFTGAKKTAVNTALIGYTAHVINDGGDDITGKLYNPCAVSKQIAMSLPTPFTQSETWCMDVSSHAMQRNMGSLTRRKPRLTSVLI